MAERIHDAAHEVGTDGNIQDPPRPAYRVPGLNPTRGSQEHDPHLVLSQVLGDPVDPAHVEDLPRERALESDDPRDAVTDREDVPDARMHIGRFQIDEVFP